MSNKMYALYVRYDEGSMWSDVKAVSKDIEKLSNLMMIGGPIYIGSYDNHNEPNMVRYKTPEGKFPHFKIVGIPYVC